METHDWLNTVLVLLVIVVVGYLVAGSILVGQTRAVCKSHGWDSGYHYSGEEICTQEITCTVDDVIAGVCKPIEIIGELQ